jgi:hypothetical protein
VTLVIGEYIKCDELPKVDCLQDKGGKLEVVFDEPGQKLHDVRIERPIVSSVKNHCGKDLVDNTEVFWADQIRSVERWDLTSLSHHPNHRYPF